MVGLARDRGIRTVDVPAVDAAEAALVDGAGTGGFGPPASFPVGAQPFSVTVGDFNGDGKPDLATANTGSNDVSILLNTCGATPTSSSRVPFRDVVGF
jgi:hypothetical protein